MSTSPEDRQHANAVVRVSYGNRGIAECPDGQTVQCRYRRAIGRPLCGDRVQLSKLDDSSWLVTEILPRHNVFVRADHQGNKQEVASNLDLAAIVIAPRPPPSRDLVERYLVAVHSLGMQALLVVNKSELLASEDGAREPPFNHIDEYRKLGFPVIETSCKTAPGVNALIPELRHRTSILVGQSGVGKSSLANHLIPDLEAQTGELSRATGKGTHTTTTTTMYAIPGGGRLIDSPGVWEYGLWDMSVDELAAGFPEFAPLQGSCRFNDCRHNGEPGCVLIEAVRTGGVFAWRYESYQRLLRQSGMQTAV